MAHYKFITTWRVNATVEDVWNVIKDIRKWHEWWKGVLEVRQVKKGSDDDYGTFAHTWQSFIPYKLKFETEVKEIRPYERIKADVTGELEGTGEWEFIREPGGKTTVNYYWFVTTTMAWMNITAPFLGGLFRWNHDTVMRWGGKGLSKKLGCNVEFESQWIH